MLRKLQEHGTQVEEGSQFGAELIRWVPEKEGENRISIGNVRKSRSHATREQAGEETGIGQSLSDKE